MTDSEDDVVPKSFHRFPHDNTVINTEISKTVHGSYSTSNMPKQYMSFDQRSMHSRRETSPMSMRSFANSSRMLYAQPFAPGAMSYQGSVYNGRSRSPMSVQSGYSIASITAIDIACAFKNNRFNKADIKFIRNAYYTYLEKKRKKIKKRRNVRHCRKNSESDSGEEGSSSSISSNDSESPRCENNDHNIPKYPVQPPENDLNNFTTLMRENDTYKDCTEHFKQNSLRNLLNGHSRDPNQLSKSFMPQNNVNERRFVNILATHRDQCGESNLVPKAPAGTLKERFMADNSLLLPIQRFNRSGVNPNNKIFFREKPNQSSQKKSVNNRHEESDREEIFATSTNQGNSTLSSTLQQKRVLEAENVNYPDSKRKKLVTSPVKQNKSAGKTLKKIITKNTKDFNFKKPELPVKKLGALNKDNNVPERLISKSSQPLVENVEPPTKQLKKINQNTLQKTTTEDELETDKKTQPPPQNQADTLNNKTSQEDTTFNATSASMKSFTKRKLFTQKLDFDKKNTSNDNLAVNSPQINSRDNKEKNKVRKLTSQSCLSHDVSDNNYMDLLQKFLPPDTIKNKTSNETNKWDVTLAVTMCGDDGISETYTDEEIFDVPQKEKEMTKEANTVESPKPSVAAKQTQSSASPSNENKTEFNQTPVTKAPLRRTVRSCVKSFWDTDLESDIEDFNRSPLTVQNIPKDPVTRECSVFLINTTAIDSKQKSKDSGLSVQNSCNSSNQNKKTDVVPSSSKKGKIFDNLQENEENDNRDILNRSMTRSRSRNSKENKKPDVKTLQRNKTDTVSKAKKQISNNTEKLATPKTLSSTKNSKQPISHTSIESPRLKRKREASFNTSRESLRLKQKREAKKLGNVTNKKRN